MTVDPAALSGDWLDANRWRWDEVTPLHLASPFYDLGRLRAGEGALTAFEETELADYLADGWDGLRVLHLQCHFGADSLAIAQRGAEVVGLDFSAPAISAASDLASDLGLSDRARFVTANLYDARTALPEPGSFDLVYVSWGTIVWLPDVAEWARIIAWYLKPGARLYFADGHPTATAIEVDDDGRPSFAHAYDGEGAHDVIDAPGDYSGADVVLANAEAHEWSHPVGDIVTALLDAGLSLDFLHEHYEVPWKIFGSLVEVRPGSWGWPDRRWLPLALSVGASKPMVEGSPPTLVTWSTRRGVEQFGSSLGS